MDTIVKSVLSHGTNTPDALALALKDRRVSYGELSRRMRSAAELLRKKYGIAPGDRVAISAVSKPEYIIALLGAQYVGAVTVPIDKTAKEASAVEVLQV